MRWLFLTLLLAPAACCTCKAQAVAPPQVPAASQAVVSPFDESRRLLRLGKYAEAIAELQQLGKIAPMQKGLSRELGVAYYRMGAFAKAINALKNAIREDPQDREAIQLLGLSNYLAGHPAEAIPYLEQAQTWFPQANADATYVLGVCYIQSKDYDHARSAFARMFDVPPNSAASYLFTARMLMRQEFDPVAEEYALKATSLDPKLPLAHFLLGELYLYKSRIDEAITEFQKELAINPAHAATLYKLADAYSRVLKFDDAERLLQRSIWLDATSTGPYILMGKVLEKKGEPVLAARSLQRAVAMDPNNPIPHHLLGQAYRDLGQKDDAERELKLAEELQGKQEAHP